MIDRADAAILRGGRRTSEVGGRRPRPRWRTALVAGGVAVWFGAIAVARASLLPAAPMTWIVDDDGGPGVHFTDIQPAVDAAVDGDLILVRSGSYGSFSLSEDLTVLGEPGARFSTATVTGIDDQAVLAELEFGRVDVLDCTGTVVLDALLGGGHVFVSGCEDVRMQGLDAAAGTGPPSVHVHDSHAELVGCSFEGNSSSITSNPNGIDGGPGVKVTGNARVYMARSQARGGDGSDYALFFGYAYGGHGGDGLEVADGDVLLMGRGKELIQGGRGGAAPITPTGYAGDGGDGCSVGSTSWVRHSKVNFRGGAAGKLAVPGSPGQDLAVSPGGKATNPPSFDPSLERLEPVPANGVAQLRMRGTVGNFSRLFVGLEPRVQPTAGVLVDSLLFKQTTYSLGFVPPGAVIDFDLPLDPAWGQGTTVYLQAMTIQPTGQIRRTNSVPLVLR